MKYTNQTILNASFIKRFSHSKRFQIALGLCKIEDGDTILDFGTGDGYLLTRLADAYPNVTFTGFEPILKQYSTALKSAAQYPNIRILNQENELKKSAYKVIYCLELLEHLNDADQKNILNMFNELLTEDGRLVVSVPLETGISGFIKNIVRILIRQHHTSRRLDLIKVLFGIKIKRDYNDGYYFTHVGFRHKDLEKIIRTCFIIDRIQYSPFPLLKGFLNSQKYYILSNLKQ